LKTRGTISVSALFSKFGSCFEFFGFAG
jgi:hypothetical protein